MPSHPFQKANIQGLLSGGNLVACGWPGPTNTGVPVGTPLTACANFNFDPHVVDASSNPNVVHHNGDGTCWLEIRVPGTTVVALKDITGIYVAAPNFTLQNSSIRSPNTGTPDDVGLVNVQSGGSFVSDHNSVDGGDITGERPFYGAGGSIRVRSTDFTHCGAACVENGPFDVRDSYLHDFVAVRGIHVDGLQAGAGGPFTVLHNTIIGLNSYYDETEASYTNSLLGMFAELGNMHDVDIENNLLAGGGATVYLQQKEGYAMTNVTFKGNVLSARYFPHGGVGYIGYYGPLFPSGLPGVTWSGNTILETGAHPSLQDAINHWDEQGQ
jgi:hypothetical protein